MKTLNEYELEMLELKVKYEREIIELKAQIAAGDILRLNQIRVDQNEAARLLGGLSPRTLETMRRHGNGPRFQTQGGQRVFYTLQALKDWVDSEPVFNNTSEMRMHLDRRLRRIDGTGTAG